jgi:hypothetical protein
MTDSEYERLSAVAEGDGMTLGAWVREVLLREVNGRQARRSADRSAISERVAQGKSNQFNGLDFLLPGSGPKGRDFVILFHLFRLVGAGGCNA